MEIKGSLIKELREMTSAGMLDCKKALTECNGDMAAAVDWLRQKGIAKAGKKSSRIAAEGLTKIAISGNRACLVEVNSETDFVAKNEQFLKLVGDITNALLNANPATLEEALQVDMNGQTIEAAVTSATATIGEKIALRRFEIMTKEDKDIFGDYIHMGGKISTCVILKDCDNEEVAHDLAMQIASMNPTFISRDDMDPTFIEKERTIQLEVLKNDESLAGKPENVLLGIVEGRLSKSLQEMCLVDQIYFKDPGLKISEYLKQAKTSVVCFVRYAVGEGIEKREENFADEVAKITAV